MNGFRTHDLLNVSLLTLPLGDLFPTYKITKLSFNMFRIKNINYLSTNLELSSLTAWPSCQRSTKLWSWTKAKSLRPEPIKICWKRKEILPSLSSTICRSKFPIIYLLHSFRFWNENKLHRIKLNVKEIKLFYIKVI